VLCHFIADRGCSRGLAAAGPTRAGQVTMRPRKTRARGSPISPTRRRIMKVLAPIVVKFNVPLISEDLRLRAIEAARRKFLGVFPRRNDRTFLPGFLLSRLEILQTQEAGNYWIYESPNESNNRLLIGYSDSDRVTCTSRDDRELSEMLWIIAISNQLLSARCMILIIFSHDSHRKCL